MCKHASAMVVVTIAVNVQVAYTVRVQLLEIYNEQLRDLLAPAQHGAARRLDIRNTAASGLNVPDAMQVWSTGSYVIGCCAS